MNVLSNNYPTMITEVIEAIHLMYEDYPDVETDCMLYLEHMVEHDERSWKAVIDWFNEHERCPDCGSLLQTQHNREPHTELGPGVYEDLYELYCPNCDVGGVEV